MEMLGTMQGIIHGVYWGLGSGSGFMIGGVLVDQLGAKDTFWIFAGVSGFNLLTFGIVQAVSNISMNVKLRIHYYTIVSGYYTANNFHRKFLRNRLLLCSQFWSLPSEYFFRHSYM